MARRIATLASVKDISSFTRPSNRNGRRLAVHVDWRRSSAVAFADHVNRHAGAKLSARQTGIAVHNPVLPAARSSQRWVPVGINRHSGAIVASPSRNARRSAVAAVTSTRKPVRDTVGVHVTTSIRFVCPPLLSFLGPSALLLPVFPH